MYLLTSTTDGGRCRVGTSSAKRAVAIHGEMLEKCLLPIINNFSGRVLSLWELEEVAQAADDAPGVDTGRLVYRVTAEIDGAIKGQMIVAADTPSEAESVGRWGLCEAMKLNFFDTHMVVRAELDDPVVPTKHATGSAT